MGLFGRRRETLNEQLLREGGLLEQKPHDTTPRWGETGIHGVPRPRTWDIVLTVEASVEAERVRFVTLPNGALVVQEGPDQVRPLADAVERELARPYRAEAVARGTGLWAIGARRIRVVELPDRDGEEIELAVRDGERTLRVDGAPEFGGVPELEALLDGDGVVQATRIAGDAWDVQVDAL